MKTSKEEMLKVIYEKIEPSKFSDGIHATYVSVVLIGDVIEWLDDVYEKKYGMPCEKILPKLNEFMSGVEGIQAFKKTLFEIFELREFMKNPIQGQSDKCIEFIYNLCKDA